MLSYIKRFRNQRLQKIYNLPDLVYYPVNYIPPILMAIFVVFFLNFIHPYFSYIHEFLFWFVDILKLAKVLKLKFLTEKKYYEYLAQGIFYYIALSILWDFLRYFFSMVLGEIFVHRKTVYSHKLKWGDIEIKNFPLSQGLYRIVIKTGLWRKWLGMERITIFQGDKVVLRSPYLFHINKQGLQELL